MNYIIKIFLTAFAVFIISNILTGVVIENYTTAIIVAIVLAFLNTLVKPIFIFLTLPITFITLGLFLFIINAVVIMLTGFFVNGFFVESILEAFIFSILLSITESILHKLID